MESSGERVKEVIQKLKKDGNLEGGVYSETKRRCTYLYIRLGFPCLEIVQESQSGLWPLTAILPIVRKPKKPYKHPKTNIEAW